jgi:hypothetical protein
LPGQAFAAYRLQQLPAGSGIHPGHRGILRARQLTCRIPQLRIFASAEMGSINPSLTLLSAAAEPQGQPPAAFRQAPQQGQGGLRAGNGGLCLGVAERRGGLNGRTNSIQLSVT